MKRYFCVNCGRESNRPYCCNCGVALIETKEKSIGKKKKSKAYYKRKIKAMGEGFERFGVGMFHLRE